MDSVDSLNLLNDRYMLAELLGVGGMGSVYRALDILLEREVAIKLLSEGEHSGEAQERLLREAKAIAKLNHPNIVQVYDVGQIEPAAGPPSDGSQGAIPYIVMELVEGEPLNDRTLLGYQPIIEVARQIAAALAHAHAHGIVHRDLKPENVLIAPDGTAKLMDFGLARAGASRLTAEGRISGTVFYLAPEIASNQTIDGRADLYSLGVMLFELVTGELPFVDDNPLAVISQHIHAQPAPPSELRPRLPRAWDDLILDLMAKSPDNRPPSASDVHLRLLTLESIVAVWELREPSGSAGSPVRSESLLSRLKRHRIANRKIIRKQAVRAGVGGAVALALFGATRPLQVYLVSPTDYQEILKVFVLPAWILLSAFATSFFGGLQGLVSGYMAGLSDGLAASRWHAVLRPLLNSGSGLVHSFYLILFSLLELFIPPLVPPAVYVPVYVLYGLLLGAVLSYVIPGLGAVRTTSEQLRTSVWVSIVLWLVTIPLIIATYGPETRMVLPFRLGFLAFVPIGIGLALRSRKGRLGSAAA